MPREVATGSIAVLFEDGALLAVDKPAGIAVVPGRGEHASTSLRELLQERRKERLWVVHRLDALASGVLLFARSADAHRSLSAAFEAREVVKQYRAHVYGKPPRPSFDVDAAIGPGRKGQMRVGGPLGKEACTAFRVVGPAGPSGIHIVQAWPRTGRRHQIRLHLASVGLPIVGDAQYVNAARLLGGFDPSIWPACLEALPRILLHAEELSFAHPGTGQRLCIRCKPPFE